MEIKLIFQVHDVTGKVLYRLNERFDPGLHKIEVSSHFLNDEGIYYYTISVNSNTAVRKMILIR